MANEPAQTDACWRARKGGEMSAMAKSNRFLRLPDVKAETGLSRTSIYREIAADRFPRQVRLTARAVGWWSDDIEAWKRSREPAAQGNWGY